MSKSISKSKPFVSVVLCTYNRQSLLQKCIGSILAQDYRNFELIVVDDASTDRTPEYLKSLKDKRIKIITHKKNKNIAFSRNTGIKAAKAKIIAFTDDDCIATKNWMSDLIAGFDVPNTGFIIGNVIYFKKGYKGNFPERLINNQNASFPMGCNIAYRIEVFKKCGMFDDKNFPDYHEDREMAIRAIENGYEFRRSIAAVVYHQKTYWNASSLIRSSRAVSAWPKMKSLHPDDYLDFKAPFIKWGTLIHPEDYLLILVSPVLVPIILIRFIKNGNTDLLVFFAKWPLFFILRRYFIIKEAIINRVLMF